MPAKPHPPGVTDAVASELRRLGERYGIRNIRVFGSFARGEAGADSDLDLLVDDVPGQAGFAFVRFCDEAERLLGRDVDVATVRSLHPMIRESVLAEAVSGLGRRLAGLAVPEGQVLRPPFGVLTGGWATFFAMFSSVWRGAHL